MLHRGLLECTQQNRQMQCEGRLFKKKLITNVKEPQYDTLGDVPREQMAYVIQGIQLRPAQSSK